MNKKLQKKNEETLKANMNLKPWFITEKPRMGSFLSLLQQVTEAHSKYRKTVSYYASMGMIGYDGAARLERAADRRAVALVKKISKGYEQKIPSYGIKI
jgi:hypothetical protein